MNLQLHLLFRIAAAAFLCLLLSAGLLLYRGDRQAGLAVQEGADLLRQRLEVQLLKVSAGIGNSNPFPDFDLWQPQPAGTCVQFVPSGGGKPRSQCNDAPPPVPAPAWFGRLYQMFFTPGLPASRPIVHHRRSYGTLTLTPGVPWQIAETWGQLRTLLELSGATVLAVCLLVYLNIRQALRPATLIVSGLDAMRRGALDTRLPGFRLTEWNSIAAAFNQLAAGQQQLLTERHELVVKLMGLQEEERRGLSRELHDEFGQSLAAINALALSISQGALPNGPELAAEAGQIREFTQHMLDNIRDLLRRLRPAELDELGLEASLKSLIAGWRALSQGSTDYRLAIAGDGQRLPESQAVALFRVAQECLTNATKHAAATRVSLDLDIGRDGVSLRVSDDGRTTELPNTRGIGLLGMRERVTALRGRMNLAVAEPHGLIVEVWLPAAGHG